MKSRIDFPDKDGQRLCLEFTRPVRILTATRCDEVAAVITKAEQHALAGCWVVGFVAYEAAPAFDPAFKTRPLTLPLPLTVFAVYEQAEKPMQRAPSDFALPPWRRMTSRDRVLKTVSGIRHRISEGDFYQVNFTTRLRTEFSGDSHTLFDALQASQPAGYCAHLKGAGWEVLSVSPELFFDWQPSGTLITRPMKGTAADAETASAMRNCPKEQSENLMIVDLLRNDLARLAVTGSVKVPQLFEVLELPTVWQMTSTVQCETPPDIRLMDVFRALFPCGSVTGAPKIAAMAAIAELEDAPRGAYCGAIGLIRPGGHATFNVGIRTVVLDSIQHMAECGIGSGIVFDSRPEDEFAEWLIKSRFLHRASASFELLETLRLEDGRFWLLARHLERLSHSATYFGFDDAQAAQALTKVAKEHPTGKWRIRLRLNRQGEVRTECFTLEPTPASITVTLARHPLAGDEEFLQHKTTERRLYQNFSPPPGIFDTLLWNAQGEITEFTRGNVVVELDGQRITPPSTCGLLPGVLRAELLARGDIVERVIRKEELPQATRLWFVNSLRGTILVSSFSN